MKAVALSIACLMAATAAQGSTQGNRLLLERPCGADSTTISIVPDPSLSHAIEIDGETGGVSTNIDLIRVAGACHGSGELVIRVPPAFPITIESNASGDIHLGDLGPVTARLHGDGDLAAGRLDSLLLDDTGSSDVRVAALSGASVLNLYGSGDLAVGHVQAPSLAITQTGSGDVELGGGQVGKLVATLSGSGDLAVAATVGGGTVTTTGDGDVSIARVLGDLSQTQTGSGDITVHARGQAAPSSVMVMPAIDVGHAGTSASHQSGADVAQALVVLVVSAGGAALLWRWRRRRRQPPAGVSTDPRVAATAERFEALARRVGRMEALVTSRDFELNRRFREMGD